MSDQQAQSVPPQPQIGGVNKSINIKILGAASVLLFVALVFNSMGGGATFQSHGRGGAAVHEASLPLQKRPRKSRYSLSDDPDIPETVMVAPKVVGAVGVPPSGKSARGSPPPPPLPADVAAAANAAANKASAAKVDAVDSRGAPYSFARFVDSTAASLTQDSSLDGLSCHAREGFDLAGDTAYVWGLSFNVASAGECCAACAAQRKICGSLKSRGKLFWRASRRERTQARCSGAPGVCNAWVFCPGSDQTPGAEDRCFSYTIHNHTKGECWLKHENVTSPTAAGPTLPLRMRRAPRKDWPWAVATNVWPWEVPEKIPWQAGLLTDKGAPAWKAPKLPDWHHKFCNGKHGPC